MFGGLGWMIGGNMAVGVMRDDRLIVRIEPEETEAALREPHVHVFGRSRRKPMTGFVLVEPAGLERGRGPGPLGRRRRGARRRCRRSSGA